MVLLHDVRLADGRGVGELDLGALRRTLPGLLTLDEGVEAVGPDLPLLLDLKGAAVVEPLGRWLSRRSDSARLAVCDEDPVSLAALRAAAPAVARWRTLPMVGSGPGERRRRYLAVARRARLAACAPALAAEVGATALSVDRWALTARLCAAAHRHGLEVAAWTVNRPGVARLMARRGADYVTTDAPGPLRESTAQGGGAGAVPGGVPPPKDSVDPTTRRGG